MNDKYVIMRNGDFLMKPADLSFRGISWAGHRNLAQIFTLDEANAMKKKFDEYTSVEIVPLSETCTFGKMDSFTPARRYGEHKMTFEYKAVYVMFYGSVYDIIVENIGMRFSMLEKHSFVLSHMPDAPYVCDEYRFGSGCLGSGCKYRRETNTVDYYTEDQSKLRDEVCEEINLKLSNLMKKYEGYIKL